MDVQGIRGFAARLEASRRSWRTVATVGLAVAAVVGWMVWQSRLTQEAIRRADAAEHSATQARLASEERPRKDPAVRRSRHDDPEQIARMKRLYDEVDGLTRIQERVDEELSAMRRIAARRTKAAVVMTPPMPAPAASPAPAPAASH